MEYALVKFPLNDDTWEKIHTAFNDAELHLITGILDGEGVECRVRSSRVPQLPFSHGALGCRGYLRTQSESAYGPAHLDGLSQSLVRGRGVAAHLWVTQRGVTRGGV